MEFFLIAILSNGKFSCHLSSEKNYCVLLQLEVAASTVVPQSARARVCTVVTRFF